MRMTKEKKNRGFTLIELIIAIAILVILTGLLAPQVMRQIEKARQAKIIHACDEISRGFELLWAEHPKLTKKSTQIYLNYGVMTGSNPEEAEYEKYALEYMKTLYGDEMNKCLGFILTDDNGNVVAQLWKYLPDGIPKDKKEPATYYIYKIINGQRNLEGPYNNTDWAKMFT